MPSQKTPRQRKFSLNGETLILDDALRSTIPGKYVRLPDGMTYYEQVGPQDGFPVVFINGFSIPGYLWDHNFMPLAGAGFHAVRFDFFGRGYSDRPNIGYGPDVFLRQTADLLAGLNIKTPVHLVGSSMGGIVAAIITDRRPDLVDKLVLIDPAGMMPPPSFPFSALQFPLIGEAIMHLLGNFFLAAGMKTDLLHPEMFPEYVANYLPQMKIIGFKRALLSTMRSGMLFNQREVYQHLGQQKRSILLLWGKEDRTIPLAVGVEMSKILPGADFRVIENAGHVPQYELPEVVNPILIDFLKKR